MATKSTEVSDNKAPVAETVELVAANLSVTTTPVLIVGVNRKVNIGNFENIDLYFGAALPLPGTSVENMDQLEEALERIAERAYKIAAVETGRRYDSIKDMATKGQIPASPDE